jgi:hypothetical protein
VRWLGFVCMTRHLLVVLAGLASLVAFASPVVAQPKVEPSPPREQAPAPLSSDPAELNKQSMAAFARHDYKRAETILRRLVEVDDDNFVPWYNLACALSSQGNTNEAGPALENAIERGFSDLRQMQIDPHLANLRKTENYQKLVKGWTEILSAHAEARLEDAKKKYGPSYTYEKDQPHRLAYVSAFPAQSFGEAKTQIRQLISWWETSVCPPPPPSPTPPTDEAARKPEIPWVLVILPSPTDYRTWAMQRYGDSWERIGGVYSHDNKSLIAKDIGSTLRHEFWHVLHWRHMDVLGQRHPIWIMEGLCSLMEDVEISSSGKARPLASWRTNQAGQLARTGKLTPWEVLFKLDQGRFTGTRPLAFYGQSRSIFMWLFEQGKLKDWYAAYTAGYKDDPTGLNAFETVFGKPVKKVEADFKTWLRKLPIVDEDFPVGSAVLPFDVDPVGAGDGLTVSMSSELEQYNGGGGRQGSRFSRAGGIQPRDVIMSIDEKPVRETGELIRLLADYGPGTEVTVTYRRNKKVATTKVTLIEKR